MNSETIIMGIIIVAIFVFLVIPWNSSITITKDSNWKPMNVCPECRSNDTEKIGEVTYTISVDFDCKTEFEYKCNKCGHVYYE
jgi:hypothetical protein